MFGYIAPNMEALNEEQKKRYRAVYCGLCQALGALSGHSGRVLLSHDMTFLALLLSSLEDPEEKEEKFRCAVHPVKEQACVRSRAVEYAAGMNLILMGLSSTAAAVFAVGGASNISTVFSPACWAYS